MHIDIEQKLDMMAREINEIKKELIIQRIQQVTIKVDKTKNWEDLSKKISKNWDHVSVNDEIRQQREKFC